MRAGSEMYTHKKREREEQSVRAEQSTGAAAQLFSTLAARWPNAGSSTGSASSGPCREDASGGSTKPRPWWPEVTANVSVTPSMPGDGRTALHPLLALCVERDRKRIVCEQNKFGSSRELKKKTRAACA